MKKVSVIFLGIFFGLTMLFAIAQAAEKFAYVSMEGVANGYLKAKDYMKSLEGKQTTYTQEIDKKRNEVKQYQEKFNLLSDKEKDAKSSELEAKINGLQDLARQKQTDLRKEELDKTIELSKDIKEAINKYSEKEGYTLVFDAAALTYHPKSMDITDKIIEILNKGYKK